MNTIGSRELLGRFPNLVLTYLRRARDTLATRDAAALSEEAAIAKAEADDQKRKREAHDMVADSIRRELADSKFFLMIPILDRSGHHH